MYVVEEIFDGTREPLRIFETLEESEEFVKLQPTERKGKFWSLPVLYKIEKLGEKTHE